MSSPAKRPAISSHSSNLDGLGVISSASSKQTNPNRSTLFVSLIPQNVHVFGIPYKSMKATANMVQYTCNSMDRGVAKKETKTIRCDARVLLLAESRSTTTEEGKQVYKLVHKDRPGRFYSILIGFKGHSQGCRHFADCCSRAEANRMLGATLLTHLTEMGMTEAIREYQEQLNNGFQKATGRKGERKNRFLANFFPSIQLREKCLAAAGLVTDTPVRLF